MTVPARTFWSSYRSQLPPIALSITLLGFIAIMAFFSVYLVVEALSPPPITYPTVARVLNSPVTPGGELILEVERCAYQPRIFGTTAPIEYDVTRQLVSQDSSPSQVVMLPSIKAAATLGCNVTDQRLETVPESVPPGPWRIEGTATANGKTSYFYSEPFEIAARR